jgi:sugar lactone lactonase YvrE
MSALRKKRSKSKNRRLSKGFFKSKLVLIMVLLVTLPLIGVVTTSMLKGVYAKEKITITEFSLPNTPNDITKGPDGNVWYTIYDQHKIARISPYGHVVDFSVPVDDNAPHWLAVGSDNNLWYTRIYGGYVIGRMTPNGEVTEFTHPESTDSHAVFKITKGPDGNMWYIVNGRGQNMIGRVTPTGDFEDFPIPVRDPNISPVDITTGSDGNIWYTRELNWIGRVTPSGEVTEFQVSIGQSSPWGIALGPDGNIWFTERFGNKIGKITPSGDVTEFEIPTEESTPNGITTGPDGNIWFVESATNKIGRITPSGEISEFKIPTDRSQPQEITAGADGNIWFTETLEGKIGRVNLTDLPKPTLGDFTTHVSLGDSYSSGEGAPNPDYLFGTDIQNNRCHRSSASYAYLFANMLVSEVDMFFFRACSGAKIRDFYHRNRDNQIEQAQLYWLHPYTKFVTLTVGGNDIGFGDVMAYCTLREAEDQLCQKKFEKIVNNAIGWLGNPDNSRNDTLAKLFHDINLRISPETKVFVVGYPRLFPEDPPASCDTGVINHNFVRSDMLWMNDVGKKLNDVIEAAASDAGFIFVDTYDAFDGHEVCTSDAYLNKGILSPRKSIQNWSFHPNVEGHQILKLFVESYL